MKIKNSLHLLLLCPLLLGLYKKAEVKTSSRSTKAEMVKAIEKALQGESLDGLEGATMRSLSALLVSIS